MLNSNSYNVQTFVHNRYELSQSGIRAWHVCVGEWKKAKDEIVDPEPTRQAEQIRNSVDMTGIPYWNQSRCCVYVYTPSLILLLMAGGSRPHRWFAGRNLSNPFALIIFSECMKDSQL